MACKTTRKVLVVNARPALEDGWLASTHPTVPVLRWTAEMGVLDRGSPPQVRRPGLARNISLLLPFAAHTKRERTASLARKRARCSHGQAGPKDQEGGAGTQAATATSHKANKRTSQGIATAGTIIAVSTKVERPASQSHKVSLSPSASPSPESGSRQGGTNASYTSRSRSRARSSPHVAEYGTAAVQHLRHRHDASPAPESGSQTATTAGSSMSTARWGRSIDDQRSSVYGSARMQPNASYAPVRGQNFGASSPCTLR